MSQPQTSQPPKIVTNFARHLSNIIADYLIDPDLDDRRHPLKDRLAIKLMLTLSKQSYRHNLLFRDYSRAPAELWIDYVLPNNKIVQLYAPAIDYVHSVLSKRIALVSKHQALPTNMHKLLLIFCRYSTEKRWLKARIERLLDAQPVCCDDFFEPIAKILKRQYRHVLDRQTPPEPQIFQISAEEEAEYAKLTPIGAVAKTFREKYGLLFLKAGQNRAVLLDEMSLFDVVEAAPTPLEETFKRRPRRYASLVEGIVVVLNEKYGLLRSCGLPPEEWSARLSSGHLRELKRLKKSADAYLKAGQSNCLHSAYEQAFGILLAKTDKIAGFADFTAFALSEVGAALLKTEMVSLDDHDEDDEEHLLEKIAGSEFSSIELEDGFERLLIDYQGSFTAITAYFFKQAIILQRPLTGESGILQDEELHRLAADDVSYAGLDTEKLNAKLIQKTRALIEKHGHLDVDAPAS